MNENMTEPNAAPDELLDLFKGPSLVSIITFTVLVHLLVLGGSSVPFLIKSVVGKDTSGLSEEERVESAVREATASLRKIAEEHGMNPQELSSQFTGGTPRKRPAEVEGPKVPPPAEPEPPTEPETPKTPIEKELDVKAAGPALPDMDDEDLFK